MRFPEFSGEWERCKLSDVCSFFSGGTPSSSKKEYYDGNIPFIRSGEIHRDNTELFITEEGLNNSAAKMVDTGDLLLALYGATSGDISISHINGAINQAILCIRTAQNRKFIESIWLKHVKKLLQTYLQGGQGNLSADIVKNLSFYFAQDKEQEKLASFVYLLDQRIETQKKIIEKYESLIKGIIASLRTTGLKNNAWGRISLCEVLIERKELNKQLCPVFSVSVSHGVINQIEYLGRSFAAKDTSKYHVVHYGDIIYTKSPTGDFPYGIVKQNYNQEKVAVSPLYGVYAPKNYSIGVFLNEYFKSSVNTYNYLHPLIQKGAKNTINISNQHFLENKVAMPLVDDELASISKLLLSLNAKAMLMQHIKDNYEQQKQYLLRQMFI